VMEVNQLTGYDVSNLDDLRNRVKAIKRVENNDGKVVLYFDEVATSPKIQRTELPLSLL